MKRSGLLSEEDVAKFEAVKRDPKAAEALFQAHQAEKREAAAEPEPAAGGLIGPTLNGLLDLPFGGGLREAPKLPLWSLFIIKWMCSMPQAVARR